jgi:hypothetical protein
MRLNARNILLGGFVFYLAQWVFGILTGVLLHEGILEPMYQATPAFWRPELQQEPMDMGALMPRWIAVGLITTFIFTAIYDNIREAFHGSGPIRGAKFGFVLALLYGSTMAGWSGIFNLPDLLWFWWALEGFYLYVTSAAVMGWFIGRFGKD